MCKGCISIETGVNDLGQGLYITNRVVGIVPLSGDKRLVQVLLLVFFPGIAPSAQAQSPGIQQLPETAG